jgi:photosystem II stability/assembly factor-like uncharacterized protein
MNRLIPFIIIFSLTLGSCSTPPGATPTVVEQNEPTVTLTAVPTNTPNPKPSLTPTTLAMLTATTVTESSPTPLPEETVPLPELTSGLAVTITQIAMIDTFNGWGIGHQANSGDRILFTTDGGNTWVDRTPPLSVPSESQEMDQKAWGYFLDLQTAWTIFLPRNAPPPIQTPIVWQTNDGGQTWNPSQPLPLTGAESFFIPENFSFINPMEGWLLVHVDAGMSHDYSYLFATYDGGVTWQRLIDPYGEGLQSLHNTSMAFADSQFGWVTKDNLGVLPGAFIEQSRDGGQTWEKIFLPAPPEIDWFSEVVQCATSAPTFPEPQMGLVLVNCRTFDEQTFTYTYRTLDQGNTWQFTQLPTPAESLIFLDTQFGWAFGRDFYQSTDGGLSWVRIKTVNWDGQFSFVDTQTGWAVAQSDTAFALVITQDGANTWQLLDLTIK